MTRLINSKLKTFLKRRGFRPTYGRFRDGQGLYSKSGILFRFRIEEHTYGFDPDFELGSMVVDWAYRAEFDRWANSIEGTFKIHEFMEMHK